MSDDARSGMSEIAHAVSTRRILARDLAAAALARIEQHNPALNAVIALRGESALEEAEVLDRSIAGGARPGPLAGVPVLIKDMEDVAGMRTYQGSRLFADGPAAADDGFIPARLRAAGAIILGKTNQPEFATEGYTDNLLFGATRNPWSTEWSPGGSSGGSAAAVASGMVPFATGTDGGGSIRIPAAMCGLVGLKPSLGVVPRGDVPDWLDLTTHGPFATSVADLRLVLAVESGPATGDPASSPFGASDEHELAPPTRLVAMPRTSDLGPLPGPVERLFGAAVAAFGDLLGIDATWLEPGTLFDDGDPDLDWFTLAAADHVVALGRHRVEAGLELMHPAARAFLRAGLAVSVDEYISVRRRRFGYVRALDDLLGPSGLLLTPTVASEGWYADGRLTPDARPGEPLPADVFSTAVQNMTGHPAITVPAGRFDQGLPFGLQVTGARFSDRGLLDLAARWEAAHPWPVVAPGYEPFTAGAVARP